MRKWLFPYILNGVVALCLVMTPLQILWGAASDSSEKKAVETPELETLSNEELLKQASHILDAATGKTFARLRAQAKSEILLFQNRQNTILPDIPEKASEPSDVGETDAGEVAKMKSEHAKKRLEALQQNLELLRKENALSDAYIRQTESALSASQSLMNTIDSLHLHLLEIRLRVEDGTLSPDKIQDTLRPERLKNLKADLVIRENELRRKSEAAHEDAKQMAARIENVRKTIIEAEARLAAAEKKYSREQKRQTLEKKYAGQPLEKLMAKISEAEEERVLFNGAFNLSHSRFVSSKKKADQLRKEIGTHSKPETEKDVQLHSYTRSEEAEQAMKAAEALASYHESHVNILKTLSSVLSELIKAGEAFQGDATVLIEHLFSMQVLAKKLEDTGSEADGKRNENVRTEALNNATDSAAEQMTEAVAAVQEANDTLNRIPEQMKASQKNREATQERLIRLKEARDSALQARQWASELEKLTAEQLISRFRENDKKLETSKGELEAIRKAAADAQAGVDEIQKKIGMLKNPFLRTAQQESLEEKQNIRRLLHQIANLELQAETGDTPGGDKPALSVKSDNAPEASLSENWQNLLSTHSGVISEKQRLRSELLSASQAMKQKNGDHATILSETAKLTIQHHANALELKKRLGRKEIEREMIPNSITSALKKDMITRIEDESAELMNKDALLRQEIETLSQPDEALEKSNELLTKALNAVGKRLDITGELRKLEQGFERKPGELAETERKELEHVTIRRMEVENTVQESFFSFFVPSESAKNLTELLQAYYRNTIELEFRHANVEERKNITDLLASFAEAEQTAVSEMLPLLREAADHLEIRKAEEWVKIRARLLPDKAEELIADFKTRTGHSLSVPPPMTEKEKPEVVQKVANMLFERHVEQVAAKKWIDIFQQRISSEGIEKEIGEYLDQKGALDAAALTIQRRIKQLNGHSHSDLETLTPEEKPKTQAEWQRLLKGEIGILRADRYKLWIQKAIEVIVKIASILIIAVFLHGLLNVLSKRFRKRSQKSEAKKASRVMVILPLLKTFIKFFIWIVATMAILNSLGFNIGAILAGFGIGGIAIAMASKETLSDIIGGISIFLSGSLKAGDIILFNGENHKVTDIGLRYTRLRPNATKYLVTVPNSLLAQAEVINVTEAPGFYININIPLSNRNTKEQVGQALALIVEIISGNPDLKLKMASLGQFNDYALVLFVRYIIHNIPARHKLQSEVNQEIVRQFREHSIEFAFQPFADVGTSPGLSIVSDAPQAVGEI